MDLIKSIENEFLKEDLPSFGPGDTVKVNVKVSEGNRERTVSYTHLTLPTTERV